MISRLVCLVFFHGLSAQLDGDFTVLVKVCRRDAPGAVGIMGRWEVSRPRCPPWRCRGRSGSSQRSFGKGVLESINVLLDVTEGFLEIGGDVRPPPTPGVLQEVASKALGIPNELQTNLRDLFISMLD